MTIDLAPVVVSFGGGVDSTALLVEMVRRGKAMISSPFTTQSLTEHSRELEIMIREMDIAALDEIIRDEFTRPFTALEVRRALLKLLSDHEIDSLDNGFRQSGSGGGVARLADNCLRRLKRRGLINYDRSAQVWDPTCQEAAS